MAFKTAEQIQAAALAAAQVKGTLRSDQRPEKTGEQLLKEAKARATTGVTERGTQSGAELAKLWEAAGK